MKKLIPSYIEHFKPVRLYLDDLKNIVDILSESCEEIKIQVGKYLLDNLDEITV